MKMRDKVAVITGGNSGIGLATAKALISEGAKVVIFGRNQDTLDQAIQALGPNAVSIQGDVTQARDLQRLFASTQQTFGKVDVLFANAGIAEFVPFKSVDTSHFDRLFDINVRGVYFTVQHALPVLNDSASIILTSSVAGNVGLSSSSVYAATKAAVRSFARTLSAELIERGIRVNAISPGLIETPILGRMGLTEPQLQQFGEYLMNRTPAKRLGSAEEIAQAVLFLASDDTPYLVGAEIAPDGGLGQL